MKKLLEIAYPIDCKFWHVVDDNSCPHRKAHQGLLCVLAWTFPEDCPLETVTEREVKK